MRRFCEVTGKEYDLFPLSVLGGPEGYEAFQQQVALLAKGLLEQSFPCEVWQVVEGGCGTGHTTRLLLETMSGISLTAIDNEPVMLAQSKQHVSEANVTWVEADILAFLRSQPTGSCDAFVSAFTLHNLAPSDRQALIREVGRVLKKGGVYVNGDKVAQDNEDRHTRCLNEQMEAFRIFDTVGRPDVRAEWEVHYRADDAIRFTEAEQTECLVEAGFDAVEVSFRRRMDVITAAVKK